MSPQVPHQKRDIDAIIASLPSRVDVDLAHARGFPNEAYTNHAFFEYECRQLFPNTWVLAGFEHDIPQYGDVLPVDIAGAPVLLVRKRNGDIAVFHNACRHRGASMVDAPCSKQVRLVCPYHAWTYDLDGKLVGRPYFDGNEQDAQALPADPSLNLREVRMARWLGMIFVNLSGSAEEFDTYIQTMTKHLGGYDLNSLVHAGKLEFDVQANWKFAGENFIEQYHVFRAHPALLNFSPMKDRKTGRWDGYCFSTHYQFPQLEAGRGADLPHFPNLTEELQRCGIWFYLYPNLGIEVFPDQLIVFRVVPLAPDKMREEIHIYLMREAVECDRYEAARNAVFDTWHDLNMEDVGLLEMLQRGRSSPSYDGGVFSRHWEAPTLGYSRIIAAELNKHH